MRKKQTSPKYNPLPPKPLHCALCSFVGRLGPNELQLHLDAHHQGWANNVIRKMDIRQSE